MRRRFFTASGTSSWKCRHAKVFSRMLNRYMNAWSKPTCSISDTVSACSASVSPQKPVITSVLSEHCGSVVRIWSTRRRKASRV